VLRTVVEFRRRTLLPLDDDMGFLRESIPALTRSALRRCLVRRGISRLPSDEEASSKRKTFREAGIGYVHFGSCQLRTAERKVRMFLAIGRVPNSAYVEFHAPAEMAIGAAIMRGVVADLRHPHRADRQRRRLHRERLGPLRHHAPSFDRVCGEHGTERRPTRPYHPWTSGQAERMSLTVTEATAKAFHHETGDGLRAHVLAFVSAYDFAVVPSASLPLGPDARLARPLAGDALERGPAQDH
jgi:hypothetical protein